MNLKEDIRLAQNARRNAYIKSGEYTIGVLIKTKSGRKYTGCNIEINSSEMICAEQVALTKAISEGEKEFDYMVIMGGKKDYETEKYLPCKTCREMMSCFVDEDFKIYIVYQNKIEEYLFSQV